MIADRVSIPIADVITVSPALSPLPSTQNHNNHVDGNVQGQQQQLKHFTVVYAKRCGNSANVNKWRHHTISLHNNDFRIVDLWIRTLQTAIQGESMVCCCFPQFLGVSSVYFVNFWL